MKDFYLRLGIDPNCSPEDLQAALEQHPELEDAARILGNAQRRQGYDRTVSTIRSIGMLRHRLNLDSNDSWFLQTCPDFAPRLHKAKFSARPAKPATEPAPQAEPRPAERKQSSPKSPLSWLQPLYIGLALAAMLALIYYLL